MPKLSKSARRVQRALKEHGLELQVVELPSSTRTAVEAARAVGCDVAQIVKSLVFRGVQSENGVLVIASGPNRVDVALIGELVGEEIAMARAAYVREVTGYAIGGVPPLGHNTELRTFVDEDLLRHDMVWAAAGTPHAVFQLAPQVLVEITGGQVVQVK